jgi:hypothetical protein
MGKIPNDSYILSSPEEALYKLAFQKLALSSNSWFVLIICTIKLSQKKIVDFLGVLLPPILLEKRLLLLDGVSQVKLFRASIQS